MAKKHKQNPDKIRETDTALFDVAKKLERILDDEQLRELDPDEDFTFGNMKEQDFGSDDE